MRETLMYDWPGGKKVEIVFDRASKEFTLFGSCFKLHHDDKAAIIIDDEGMPICTGFFDGNLWRFEEMKQIREDEDLLMAAIKITCVFVQYYQRMFGLVMRQRKQSKKTERGRIHENNS